MEKIRLNSGRIMVERTTIKECFINDKRVEFDASEKGNLDQAIKFYEYHGFEYIGSSTKEWINGVLQKKSPLIHYFKKKAV